MSSPLVSIITRTRDRPVLLKRAMESVLGQKDSPSLEWIVVNDAGDQDTVEELLGPAREQLGSSLLLLNMEKSEGMEHASNAGIAHAGGEFLAIHDDDDSWDPCFLKKMANWLTTPGHEQFAGVVCHSIRVEESIDGQEVHVLRESPFNFWLRDLSAWSILEQNPFPPISFLFRRSAYETVGPFDESLPVLGDWEFNLRLVLRWPLGILAEPLARYHHRVDSRAGPMANSITAGHDRHRQWDEALRKRWAAQPPGKDLPLFGDLARIAGAAKQTRDMTHQLLSLPIRPGPQV